MGRGRLLVLGLGLAMALSSGSALADEAADGEKIFKSKCMSCHSVEAGKHKMGPSLAGVFERQAGTEKFNKYKALKDSDVVWTAENLDKFLTDPKKFVGQNIAMPVKLKEADQRASIIAYLKTLN